VPDWDYAMALSFFRLAAISQGIYARALAGNASNERAMKIGPYVNMIAEQAHEYLGSGAR